MFGQAYSLLFEVHRRDRSGLRAALEHTTGQILVDVHSSRAVRASLDGAV